MADRELELKYNQLAVSASWEEPSLEDIIDQAKEKFGDEINLSDLKIEPINHQARGCSCCHDPSDYDLYLVITHHKESSDA